MRGVAAMGLALICAACGGGTEVGGNPAGVALGQELLEIDEARAVQGGDEAAAWEHETRDGEPGKLVLWGVRKSASGLAIRIYSEGCTTKGDIRVVVYESLPPKLLFLRAKPDRCAHASQYPNGVELSFRWSDLRIRPSQAYKILNRIEAP